MKKRFSLILACGSLMLCSGALLARTPDHGHSQHDQHASGHGRGHGDDRGHGHSGHGERRYAGMHDRGRHEGWYRKGGHVPAEYRGRTYVVTDWRRVHLHEPRRGYHWVRSDNGDFLLIAITTGIIVDILTH